MNFQCKDVCKMWMNKNEKDMDKRTNSYSNKWQSIILLLIVLLTFFSTIYFLINIFDRLERLENEIKIYREIFEIVNEDVNFDDDPLLSQSTDDQNWDGALDVYDINYPGFQYEDDLEKDPANAQSTPASAGQSHLDKQSPMPPRLYDDNGIVQIHNRRKKDVSHIEMPIGRGHHGRRQRQNYENSDEKRGRIGRIKPLVSVQFNGDTSKYIGGHHVNFKGNGHLRHPHKTFKDWKESDWVQKLGMDQHYHFEDGVVTIDESGLYFIYAQIYYMDEHDVNGYRVYRNTATILQCTTTTHSSEMITKSNTCYTAGVEYLNEGDRISLDDFSDSRYSIFEPGKSFFGLIKLGDVNMQ